VIRVNPDRPNIEVRQRLPNIRKYEKLDDIISPLAHKLLDELEMFPVTAVYTESLEAIGYAYCYVAHILKEKQYQPVDIRTPENRILHPENEAPHHFGTEEGTPQNPIDSSYCSFGYGLSCT
jgi:hypothetical protein